MISNINQQLSRDEGRRRSVYLDSLGFQTLGVGRLVDARRNGGLSEPEIDYLFANDLAAKRAQLDVALPWWRTLDDARQGAILNLAFQLGVDGLLSFSTTLYYVKAHMWDKAAAALLQSKLAREQTPERAKRISEQLRTGVWQ